MMTHPGKKLNFMGNEIGQFRAWDEKREQDWQLLQQPEHQAFYRYMVDLNMIKLPWINSAEIIMNTDWDIYGGITPAHYKGVNVKDQTVHIDMNGLSAIMIKVW